MQDKVPAASGPCPDSSFSILLCKEYVKDFFQILDAGRESSPAAMCSSFIVHRSSLIHNIAWPRFRRGRPVKAARYAPRASRSVVVSLRLPRRYAASDSEEKAVARCSWFVARKSSPSFRIGHDQISQRTALAGSAPTLAPVGAFFYEPRVTRGNVVSLRCRGVTASVGADL